MARIIDILQTLVDDEKSHRIYRLEVIVRELADGDE